MAPTPQQAVKDAIKTAGSERELKFRDSIHLPFHQVGMSENLPAIYLCEADVPESVSYTHLTLPTSDLV